jgi:copper chaperone
MQKLIFNVEGMSCSHCENRVKKVVGSLNGVGSVDVNLTQKTVSVELDQSSITEKQIKDAIEEQGYVVK